MTGSCMVLSSATQAGIHAAAGAMAGGINAAITGGDIGRGALTGWISAGLAKYAGGALFEPNGYDESLLSNNFAKQLRARSATRGVTGGISAEIYGGSFGQGFGQGAWTAAYGYACNDWLHDTLLPWFESWAAPVPGTGYRNSQAGYSEIVGFSVGVVSNNESWCISTCGGVANPGWMVSQTYSSSSPTAGWSLNAQVGYGYVYGRNWSLSTWAPAAEHGFGTPWASLMV